MSGRVGEPIERESYVAYGHPVPTEVVIVQHAEKERRAGDAGLTGHGRAQAARTASHLAGSVRPAALYASPMRRALETATPIAETFELKISIDSRLRERMNWEGEGGQPIEDFLAEWARASIDRDHVPSSGDTSRQAGQRFLEAIDELADRHADQVTLVVSHGGVTVDLLRTLLGDEAVAGSLPGLILDGVPSCAITRLVKAPHGWEATEIASTEHL